MNKEGDPQTSSVIPHHPASMSPKSGDSAADKKISAANSTTKRTFLLKVLIVGFLLLSWSGGVRCYAVFAERNILEAYISNTGLAYIALGGVVWALAGLVSAVSLWLGLTIAARLSRLIALTCFIWYWFDYLFLSQSPLSHVNWPFSLAVSLLALGFAWWVPALPKEDRFLHRRDNP